MGENQKATDRTAAELFEIMWHSLVEVIGTAATANLLRRSARQLVNQGLNVDGLSFDRQGFEYGYLVPQAWRDGAPGSTATLRALAVELRAILRQLTGPVLVRRLESNPALAGARRFDLLEAP